MSTISASTTSTTAYKVTADTTGTLVLQTGSTPTTAVTIDASQNVGLGVTPSGTWKLDVAGYVKSAAAAGGLYDAVYTGTTAGSTLGQLRFNGSGSGVTAESKIIGALSAGSITSSYLGFYVTSSGSQSQAMTLDASGNLCLGTTSPISSNLFSASSAASNVAIFNSTVSTSGGGGIRIAYNGTTELWMGYYSFAANTGTSVSDAGIGARNNLILDGGTGQLFSINGSEKARINSSGNLLVGATSTLSTEKLSVQTSVGTGYSNLYLYSSNASYSGSFANFTINSATSGAYEFLRMFTSTQEVLRISGNGNIANLNNSYTAISDIKLKENIVDATPKLAELMQVRIVNYNLKENPELKQIGVVAQELEQIFPALIDELRDTDAEGNDLGTTTKSVKYSVFVPMLIKAIQEQQAIIENLTNRITALEAK